MRQIVLAEILGEVLKVLLEELHLMIEVLDHDLVEEVRHLQPAALAPPRLNAELRHSPSCLAAALPQRDPQG